MTHDVLAFYGHDADDPAHPGRACLSQWWPAAFTVDGVRYPTAEHWMMAGKARFFDDDGALADVLAAPDPGTAKAIGRRVSGFDSSRWAAVAYDVVVAGNLAKFGAHAVLHDYLLGTAPALLVEASPDDRIWGVGLAADDPAVLDPARWRGTNLLGRALMEVRDTLGAQ